MLTAHGDSLALFPTHIREESHKSPTTSNATMYTGIIYTPLAAQCL